MDRYTFRDKFGVAHLDGANRSNYEILQRLARFEDQVERAKKILFDVQSQQSDKTNMLELHPKAKYVSCGEEQRQRIIELQKAYSELFYLLDDYLDSDKSYEAQEAYKRLEESLFWADKSISREKVE